MDRKNKHVAFRAVQALRHPLYPLTSPIHSGDLQPVSVGEVMANMRDDLIEAYEKPSVFARYFDL